MSGPRSRLVRLHLGVINASLLVAALSCGGDDGTAPSQTVRAEGVFSGDFTASLAPGVTRVATMSLAQTGTQVSGGFATSELRTAGVSGSLSDLALDLTISFTDGCEGSAAAEAELSANGRQLTGTYSATDCHGSYTGTFTLVKFSREVYPPTVAITEPENIGVFIESEQVEFEGAGTDPDGGAVTLVWRSNLDGDLGSGASIVRDDLSTGAHTISLVGFDDEFQFATNSRSISLLSNDPGAFPDVRGTWTGQYSVTNCALSGATNPLLCADVFAAGVSRPVWLDLKQAGSLAAGDASQGDAAGRVRGIVDQAGSVTLEGTLTSTDVETEITSWETQLLGDSLIGDWVFETRDPQSPTLGTATVTANLKVVGPDVPTFASCPVVRTLPHNWFQDAELGAGDCQIDPAQTYVDVYALAVAAGDRLSIQLLSNEFSTSLIVADVDEVVLGSDGGAGANTAQVLLEATVDETWLLIVTTYLEGESGGYRLINQRVLFGE